MQSLPEAQWEWHAATVLFQAHIFQAWVCGSVRRDTPDGSAWHQLSLLHAPVPSSNGPEMVRLHWRAPPTPWLLCRTGGRFCEPVHSEASLLLGGLRLLHQQKICPQIEAALSLAGDSEGLLHTDRLQLSAEASPRVFLFSPMFLSSTTWFMFLIASLLQNLGNLHVKLFFFHLPS